MPAGADTMKKNKRRATKVVALAAALVVAGGAAFAWWTAGGSGTGSASTGNVSGLTVVQTSVGQPAWRPGSAPRPSAALQQPQQRPGVRRLGVRVASASVVEGRAARSRHLRRHRLRLTVSRLPRSTPRSRPRPSTSELARTIAFVNKASNQDGCKGATVNLVYTAS